MPAALQLVSPCSSPRLAYSSICEWLDIAPNFATYFPLASLLFTNARQKFIDYGMTAELSNGVWLVLGATISLCCAVIKASWDLWMRAREQHRINAKLYEQF